MFTQIIQDNQKVFVNPIQESPIRSTIYAVNRCEDQVIGFEFVTKQYDPNIKCFGNVVINLCIPVEITNPISLTKAEFWATDDPCYKDWVVTKQDTPSLELQLDSDDNVTGILVRFSQYETCCYPNQMAFRLYAFDETGCKYTISSGLLIFR